MVDLIRDLAQVLTTRVAREATVLFIDIKGFTAGCALMSFAQVPLVRIKTLTE